MLPSSASDLTDHDDLKHTSKQTQRRLSSQHFSPLQNLMPSTDWTTPDISSAKPDIVDLGMNIVGLGFSQQPKTQIYDQDPLVEIKRDTTKRENRKSIDIEFQFLTFDKDQRPSNEIVEDLFDQLLQQRSFSDDIKVNLRSVPLARKWALICQDQSNQINSHGSLIKSPEWFTTKIKYLDSKELHKLERYLRGKKFAEEFLALDGHIGLMDLKLNNHEQEIEFLLISCYKSLINSPKGTDMVSQDVKVLTFFVKTMLTSEGLENRKLITDILVLISYWLPPLGRNNVLKAFNNLSELNIFKKWIESLSKIMSGEYTVFTKLLLKDLVLSSLFLMVSISEGSESVNDKKIIHYKFKEVGIYSLFHQLQQMNDENINEQINKFKSIEVTTFAHDISDELDPKNSQIDVSFKSIKSKIINSGELTEATTTILKRLVDILIKNTRSESLNAFRLIESIISSISTSNRSLAQGSDSVINASIQRLMDRLTTDDIAQRAILEAKELEDINEELHMEIETLKESLSISSGDILHRNQSLQSEVEAKDKEIESLKSRIQEMEKLNAERRMREMRKTSSSLDPHIPLASLSRKYQSQASTLMQSINQRTTQLASSSAGSKRGSLVRSKSIMRLPLLQRLDNLAESVDSSEQVNEHSGESVTSSSSSWGSINAAPKLAGPKLFNAQTIAEDYGEDSNDIQPQGSRQVVPGGFTNLQSSQKINGDYSCDFAETAQLSGSSVSIGGSSDQNQQALTSTLSGGGSDDIPTVAASGTISSSTKYALRPSILTLTRSGNAEISNSLANDFRFVSTESSLPPSPPAQPENSMPSNSSGEPVTSSLAAVPQPPPLPDMLLSGIFKTSSDTSGPHPPPPPPLPNLFKLNNNRSPPKLSASMQAPPSPPPPPVLPEFLKSASRSEADLPKALPSQPPPAPQLPDFLKLELKGGSVPPPPAPPLPGILQSTLDIKAPSPAPLPAPPPPPAPPLPSKVKKEASVKPGVDNLAIQSVLTPKKIDEISRALHKPSKQLKQLHWDKVDEVENTLWNDKHNNYLSRMNELQALGILREVEDLFDVKVTLKKSAPTTQVTRRELVSFLPRDLSQQFGINLHMFANLSEEELVKKVLKCDFEILKSTSILEFFNKDELCEISSSVLKNFKPYITDYQKGETPEKDVRILERADRLYLELCVNLRHYWRSRSRALYVMETYEKDYYDLLRKLQRFDDSIKAIKGSKSLKNLFILIREIGNFMNRKQVEGFKLASLQKLSFIKDHNQNTFLHYVEKVIRKAYPEYLTFLQDLSVLQDSAKISIEQLSQDIETFLSSVRNIEKSIEIGNLSDPKKFHPLDMVLKKISPKLPEAKKKCVLIENEHKHVLADFEKVMKYFGENSKDTIARTTFLQSFQDFITDFERVQKDNLEAEMKKKLYEKRKKVILSNQRKNKNLRAKSADNVNKIEEEEEEEEEEDVVENLLKRLKGVSNERRRISTSSLQRRESANDNELLTRAQTMLEGTKKINT